MPPKRRNKADTIIELPEEPEATEAEPKMNMKSAKNRIAELEEKIRALQIENTMLRQNADKTSPDERNKSLKIRNTNVNAVINAENSGTSAGTPIRPINRRSVIGSASKQRDNNKGCSCSGACGNKKCGCVKKNMPCNQFCRCLDECVNKEVSNENEENKENENNNQESQQDDENVVSPEQSQQSEKTKGSKEKKKKSKEAKESKESKTKEAKESKGTKTKEVKESKVTKTKEIKEKKLKILLGSKKEKKNKARTADNANTDDADEVGSSNFVENTENLKNVAQNNTPPLATTSQTRDHIPSMFDTPKAAVISQTSGSDSSPADDEIVNPMKPRRQLPRSPIGAGKPETTLINNTIRNDDEMYLPVPKIEIENEEDIPPPPEIDQAEVDWDEHQANLVVCHICKRKFYRHRIKKHEKTCKNV